MKVHNFKDSLKDAEQYEKHLDASFAHKFDIQDANDIEQRLGIDRIFTHKKSGARASVEYKSDKRENETGNVFIEIWSNKQAKVKGWAYTSLAQWLYYYLIETKEVCIMDMVQLKRYLPEWLKEFKKAECASTFNGGPIYNSVGLLVKSDRFRKCCEEVVIV